jgi:hypothetical protein
MVYFLAKLLPKNPFGLSLGRVCRHALNKIATWKKNIVLLKT